MSALRCGMTVAWVRRVAAVVGGRPYFEHLPERMFFILYTTNLGTSISMSIFNVYVNVYLRPHILVKG